MTPVSHQHLVKVENLKCGGCAHTIEQAIGAMDSVSAVGVDIEQGTVRFETDDSHLPAIKDKLKSLGYPEAGSVHGLSSGLAQAKSYVSCAIGKLHQD